MNTSAKPRNTGTGLPYCSQPLFLISLALFALGCNNSRYGVQYDLRLPEIKRVAVIPASIEVSSLHSGGVQEPRPDLVGPASDRVVDCLLSELIARDVEAIRPTCSTSAPESDEKKTLQFAIAKAVCNAIHIHHYIADDRKIFDYSVGDIPQRALGNQKADAVLLVFLSSFVPTEGREALRTTAIVIGVLTGVHVKVNTCGAAATILLVDATNGNVLWFNQIAAERDVRDGKSVEKLIHEASRYLLKPRK